MRILVFGGTGFVGLNIAAALLSRGHAVTLFDRAGLPPDAPASQRDAGPDRLDQAERPRALQKSVNRTQRAGAREAEDEAVTAVLQCVTDEHRGHREKAEQSQGIGNHRP